MNQKNVIQEGGCRCGQVRIKVTVPPFLTMACQCTGCQRMTGSAFLDRAFVAWLLGDFIVHAVLLRCDYMH
jgi:hypothetical protein